MRPLPVSVPAVDPVADVEAAVGAEVAVGGQDAPDELVPVGHLEGRPLRLDREGVDAAAAAAAAEIAEEEVVRRSAPAARWRRGCKQNPDGPVVDVRQRRHDVGRLVRGGQVPELLGVERAAVAQVAAVLVADAPAAVAALDDVHQPAPVAGVAVVVHGEEVAVLVEGQFLRVAQAGGDDLQVRAVRVAAQHRAAVRVEQMFALLGGHVEAAVADAEVELAVRPHAQAVQVVAEEGDVDAEAGGQRCLHVGLARRPSCP